MGDIFKLAITLVIISLIAGVAIAFTNGRTIDKIAEQERLAEESALNAVFPAGTKIVAIEDDSLIGEKYWIGSLNGVETGYAFKGKNFGFSSDIKFIAGIDTIGKITGLVVLSQGETPGLGTRVQEVVSTKYFWTGLFTKSESGSPWFCDQFKGISVKSDITIDKSGEWHKKSDVARKKLLDKNSITALTGATISTNAVLRGVKMVCGSKLALLQKSRASKGMHVEVTEVDTTSVESEEK